MTSFLDLLFIEGLTGKQERNCTLNCKRILQRKLHLGDKCLLERGGKFVSLGVAAEEVLVPVLILPCERRTLQGLV